MKTIHNHIIEKVFVEINTNNSEKAVAIKNDISEILSTRLFTQLETIFDAIDSDNKILRVGSLQVKTSVNVNQINETVIADVVRKIENGLKQAIEEAGRQSEMDGFVTEDIKISEQRMVSKDINDELIFISFIQSGTLPWFAGKAKLEDILANENWFRLVANHQFCDKLRRLIMGNKTNMFRFVKQIPVEHILVFIYLLFPELKPTERLINSIHNQLSLKEQPVFLSAILQLAFEFENQTKREPIANEFLRAVEKFIRKPEITGDKQSFGSFIRSELNHLTTPEKYKKKKELSDEKERANREELLIEAKEKEESSKEKIKNESLHISNAGLVLLHPFLKTFFITTGIADSSGRILNENSDLAVQALHFIATGRESVFEAELVFEKILCGLPVHHPVIRESLLTDEIKVEAEEMLRAIIKNWAALKNTTPDGLREAFIQRDGILQKTEKGYKLTVEVKTFDILLDRLPWNYNIINWYLIDKLIFVEWQL